MASKGRAWRREGSVCVCCVPCAASACVCGWVCAWLHVCIHIHASRTSARNKRKHAWTVARSSDACVPVSEMRVLGLCTFLFVFDLRCVCLPLGFGCAVWGLRKESAQAPTPKPWRKGSTPRTLCRRCHQVLLARPSCSARTNCHAAAPAAPPAGRYMVRVACRACLCLYNCVVRNHNQTAVPAPGRHQPK